MALAERAPRREPKGSPRPRIAPPTPARSTVAELEATAKGIGLPLFPWQQTAGRYLNALGPGKRWAYPEVAIIVGRQNGKTTLLVPLIISRLLAGRRVMHTAQNREFPREVFGQVADIMWADHRGKLRARPRFANGQEEIRLTNGGRYRIVAPTRGGARGPSSDDVIVDELREMDDFEFIAAAEPTLTASDNPQMIYLSNAGTETSAVLNSLRKRAGADAALAYLEWSAAPERPDDDTDGWLEANPAIGHKHGMWDYLTRKHESYKLSETMEIFETEHLCRWVVTMKPTIIGPGVWESRAASMGDPLRPVMGIALAHDSQRASAVVAWQRPGGVFGVRPVAEAVGDPVDLDDFGPRVVALANRLGVRTVVYDPYDEHLARHFHKPIPMNGRDFANASGSFVRLLEADQLHHEDGEAIAADLPWATKRGIGPGAWMAIGVDDERPITALLAAIRAVGIVYGPRSIAPRVR